MDYIYTEFGRMKPTEEYANWRLEQNLISRRSAEISKSFTGDINHDVELVIRGINRRLESYGKILYTPTIAKSGEVHLTQYTDITNELSSIVSRIHDPSPLLVGKKGDYIQISRSKGAISDLTPYFNELLELYSKTPSMQETQHRIRAEEGVTSRKEIREALKAESELKTLNNYLDILGYSDQLAYDSELEDLLKPFRGEAKGGTRKKGEKPSQEAIEALKQYIAEHRQDILMTAKQSFADRFEKDGRKLDVDSYDRNFSFDNLKGIKS